MRIAALVYLFAVIAAWVICACKAFDLLSAPIPNWVLYVLASSLMLAIDVVTSVQKGSLSAVVWRAFMICLTIWQILHALYPQLV